MSESFNSLGAREIALSEMDLRLPRNATFPTINHFESFEEYAEAYYQAFELLWNSLPKSSHEVARPE